MKPGDFRIKTKPSSRLFLLLCLVGVALVAWWAWLAGPIHTESAIQASQNSQAQPTLTNSGYNPLKSASQASGTNSASVPSSGSTASPVLPPANSQPSYPACYPISGIQPEVLYPCDCGAVSAAYPCCVSRSSVQIACPEGTY